MPGSTKVTLVIMVVCGLLSVQGGPGIVAAGLALFAILGFARGLK